MVSVPLLLITGGGGGICQSGVLPLRVKPFKSKVKFPSGKVMFWVISASSFTVLPSFFAASSMARVMSSNPGITVPSLLITVILAPPPLMDW